MPQNSKVFMTKPDETTPDKDEELICPSCDTHFFLGQSPTPPAFCPFCGQSLTISKTQQLTQPSLSTKSRATEGSISLVQGQAPINEPVQFEIGSYQILRTIGKGGMGEVFLAYDTSCGRRIALKKIKSDLEQHAQLYNRFLKEARITGQLTHPGIIPIYAIHTQENLIYYTMPYVEGETLKEILRKTREQEKKGQKLDHLGGSIPALIRVLISICQSIAYAHSKDVLHRDIKSENVIIGRFGEVLILDWGLAKIVKNKQFKGFELSADNRSSQQEKVVGTVAFMSPERALGYPATVQSDIYALGVILYQILTLQLPFRRGTLKEFRKKIQKEKLQDPSEVAPYRDVPRMLIRICQKCLALNPLERYRNVEQLIHDLENFIEGRSEWFKMSSLDIHKKEDWEFQENVLIAEHIAVTRHTEVDNWVSLMISKASFAGNTMLEAKVCIGEKGHGIGYLLSVPEAGDRHHLNDGYCLWIGSDNHKSTKLLRSTVEVMHNPDVVLQRHVWYTIKIEKIDNNIYFYLNDQLQFSYISHIPLEGTHVGIISRDADFELTDLSLYVGSQNVMVNCLAVPDAFLAHKDYNKALTEYRRIGYSFPGRAEGREGMFRAGITLLEQARNTPNQEEAKKIFDQALEEFEKLHNTPGAPLEYLGKALVYQANHDFEEEVKCYSLACRRYPNHPLMHVLQEQIMYRMHESSRSNRLATFNLIFLVSHHLKQLADTKHSNKLFSSLQKHWEPLFFVLEDSTISHSMQQLTFRLKLAFWLGKPYFISEIIDEIMQSPECNPTTLGNALYCLIDLGSWDLAQNKIDTFLSSHEAQELPKYKEVIESLKFLIISHVEGLEFAVNALNTSHLPANSTLIRSVLNLMEQALNTQKTSIVHQLYIKFYGTHLTASEAIQFDCHSIWAYLWDKNWKVAGELLQRYPLELILLENSPLHFLYGCWLYATEGKEIAQIHFSGILETSYPRSWMLASQYLNGKIKDSRWFSKSFIWERRQLYRQLTLYYHTIGDEQNLAESQRLQLQEYIHAEGKLPQLENSEIIFDQFIKIRKDNLIYPNGKPHDYFIVEAHNENSVVALSQTSEGLFVINKEYRHAVGHTLLSCPGGFLPEDEKPEDGGKRELLEETGYTGDHFKLIGTCYPFPGLCNQRLYIVHGKDVKKVAEPNLEPKEIIDSVLMSKEELLEAIRKGEPMDGILGTALFFLFL